MSWPSLVCPFLLVLQYLHIPPGGVPVFGKSPAWLDWWQAPSRILPCLLFKITALPLIWFVLYQTENHEQTCLGIHTNIISRTQCIYLRGALCIDEQSAWFPWSRPLPKLSSANISPPYLRLRSYFSSYWNMLIQHTLTSVIDSCLKTLAADVCSGMERQNLAEPVPNAVVQHVHFNFENSPNDS